MGFAQEIFLWLAHSNARQTEKMVHAYLKNFRQNDDNNGAIELNPISEIKTNYEKPQNSIYSKAGE